MEKFIIAAFLSAFLISGCASTTPSYSNMVTAFAPHIEKDGTHSFTFIANKNYPTYGSNFTPREMHEQLISSELGKRQFCMKGYEIVSEKEAAGGSIIYKGACK